MIRGINEPNTLAKQITMECIRNFPLMVENVALDKHDTMINVIVNVEKKSRTCKEDFVWNFITFAC